MPVITLTRPQKLNALMKHAYEETLILCAKHRIKNKEIAEAIGVVPSAISKQFSSGHITLQTYMTVQMLVKEKEKMQ